MIIKPPGIYGKRMPFKKHKGLLIEQVVLQHPDYIFWLSRQTPYEGSQWVHEYIDKCVEKFDAMPFKDACCSGKVNGIPCTKLATRFSLRRGSATPYFWCGECDPVQLGGGTMLNIRSRYYDALFHVWASTNRARELYRELIRQLAAAKGYNGNFTEKKIIVFYYGPDAKRICPRLEKT